MDPMHIKANVSKTNLQSILRMLGKDFKAVRLNCEAHGVHRTAWCIPDEEELPFAPWQLDAKERVTFMDRLKNMVFPSKYGTGFEYSFREIWPRGLKSHDYQSLVCHGFPIAIWGLLTPLVRKAIYSICDSFR
jgi:hypothetical protein